MPPLKIKFSFLMKCFNPSFSGRGAAHVHGVLWIDFQEVKAEGVNNYLLQEAYRKLKVSEPLEGYERNALERFTDSFVTVTRNVNLVGEEAVAIAEEVNWHSHSRSCFKGGRKTCRWKFPKFPLARTIFIDSNREDAPPRLDPQDRQNILNAVMRVLVEDQNGQKKISSKVIEIMHSPKYPNVKLFDEGGNEVEKVTGDEADEESLLDESVDEWCCDLSEEQQNSTESSKFKTTGEHSRKRSKKSQERIEGPPSKKARERPEVAYYKKMEEPDEYKRNIKSRIEDVLKIASAGGDEISYEKYEQAVMEQPRKGSEILLRRDIDEIMLNQYNPEWIRAWNGNIDVSPVYDYYGTITYVTDYFTKVSPHSAI